ncbi:MAG: hypothetical protein KDB03_12315 [Planctomycetales bacterium]|nr:hypothetical protein [Planctomycetales bacterium]
MLPIGVLCLTGLAAGFLSTDGHIVTLSYVWDGGLGFILVLALGVPVHLSAIILAVVFAAISRSPQAKRLRVVAILGAMYHVPAVLLAYVPSVWLINGLAILGSHERLADGGGAWLILSVGTAWHLARFFHQESPQSR